VSILTQASGQSLSAFATAALFNPLGIAYYPEPDGDVFLIKHVLPAIR
jgi:CubicO group peptidase (beta-lactamase class C family)